MRILRKPEWRQLALALPAVAIAAITAGVTMRGADPVTASPAPTFRQYCVQCHGKTNPMGGVSIEQLIAQRSVGDSFQHWEKVAAAMEQKRMPPEKMPQPSDADRQKAVAWIRAELGDYARKHEGDPGRVTVRRLTSGEYAYTIQDLTGLDLKS